MPAVKLDTPATIAGRPAPEEFLAPATQFDKRPYLLLRGKRVGFSPDRLTVDRQTGMVRYVYGGGKIGITFTWFVKKIEWSQGALDYQRKMDERAERYRLDRE